VNAQIFHIHEVRAESRQIAIDNAWNEYLAKVKAATEATRQMNEAHDRWMSFCRRAP